MPSEAQARITINRLLEDAGWRFLPDDQGRRENIVCEHRATKNVFAPNADIGSDFERAPQGFVDYVLLNTEGRAVAVVEAKRESIDPLEGKEQARTYAESLGVAHIFLSNGLLHYYWESAAGKPGAGVALSAAEGAWRGSGMEAGCGAARGGGGG